MPRWILDRATLSKIAPNPQALRALEQAFGDLAGLPSTIEEAQARADAAFAVAASALSLLADMGDALDALASAPALPEHQEADDAAPRLPDAQEGDDTSPRVQLGTISSQDADNVTIEGGVIDDTPIGESVASTGAFTTVSASDQITSTVAGGTPPFIVASITKVDNLHVERATTADFAGELSSPTTFPADATDLATAITLVNALKSAAISKGL